MKISVGNKELTIRKWKGKDKKQLLSEIKSNSIKAEAIMNALVYSCIEEDVALSSEEFKYVLSRIRAYSLGEDFEIEFHCNSCGNTYKRQFKLIDTVRPVFKELNEINVDGISIKLGSVKNKEFYVKKIQEDEIYDFLLRIQEINGNDAFTLNDLENIFDEMDIDTLTKIMRIYEECKFNIDDVNTVVCDCGKEQKYKFDEIPDFIPSDWFK